MTGRCASAEHAFETAMKISNRKCFGTLCGEHLDVAHLTGHLAHTHKHSRSSLPILLHHSNKKEEHGVALPCWETAQKVINGTYEMELYAAEYEANGEDWVPGRSLTPHTLFSSLSPSHNTLIP